MSETLIVAILLMIGNIVIALLNRKAIQDVHVSINSRMDQLLKTATGAARAEGVKSEVDKAKGPTSPSDPNAG